MVEVWLPPTISWLPAQKRQQIKRWPGRRLEKGSTIHQRALAFGSCPLLRGLAEQMCCLAPMPSVEVDADGLSHRAQRTFGAAPTVPPSRVGFVESQRRPQPDASAPWWV